MRTSITTLAVCVALAAPISAQPPAPSVALYGQGSEFTSQYEEAAVWHLLGIAPLRAGLQAGSSDNDTFEHRTLPGSSVLNQKVLQAWQSEEWESVARSVYSYNEEGRVLERVEQTWDGTDWTEAHRLLYEYAEGNLTRELQDLRVGSEWVSGTRRTYVYSNGQLTDWLEEVWTGTNWVNRARISITFGVDGNRAQALLQEWRRATWENDEQYFFTYVEGTSNSEVIRSERWVDGEWLNANREVYSYASGRVDTILGQEWGGSAWLNDYRKTYTYEAGYRIGSLSERWGSTSWENESRRFHTNDEQGNRTVTVDQIYADAAWLNQSRTLFEYTTTTLNEQDEAAPSALSLSAYPNPAVGAATLGFELERSGAVAWSAYDMMGRRVAEEPEHTLSAGTHTVRWDVSDLPAGVYVVRFRTEDAVATQRIVVVK